MCVCVCVCVCVCAKPSINEVRCIADVYAPIPRCVAGLLLSLVCMFFRKEREIQELTGELRSMGVPLGGAGIAMGIGGRYAEKFHFPCRIHLRVYARCV